jgi:hypothetical protein
MLNFFAIFLACMFVITDNLHAAGRYVLAMWREEGADENHAPIGNHSIFVWVFDESGNPVPGVHCYTSWGVDQGQTNADGFCEIPMKKEEEYRDVMIVDDKGSSSDITPKMTTQRNPYWGHYSYECIFLYKSDDSNPGTFNVTEFTCPPHPSEQYGQPGDSKVSYTRSITYYWGDYKSAALLAQDGGGGDEVKLANWSQEIGQTFVANGNRVWAVMFQGAIGDNYSLKWTAQILEDGPNGKPVGPAVSLPEEKTPILRPVVWPVTDAPQTTPGKTYYLKITRDSAGLNYFRSVRNNYPNGCVYENGNPLPDYDMKAIVIEMNYTLTGPTGTLKGVIKDAATSIPIDNVKIQVKQGTTEKVTYSKIDGTYSQTLPVGTYDITVSKPGYLTQTKTNITVGDGQVIVQNFALERDPSVVPIVLRFSNNSFESGLENWTQHPVQNVSYSYDTSTAHTGARSAKISCTDPAGSGYAHLWQATSTNAVTAGEFYKFTVWVRGQNVSKINEQVIGPGVRIGWANNWFTQPIRDDWIKAPTGTYDWTPLSLIVQAPRGAQQLQVALFLENSTGSIWYDDVNAEEGADTTPPPQPTLQAPQNNYTITSLPYTFDWSDVNDNNTGGSNPCVYHLQIAKDQSFSSPEVNEPWLQQSQYTLTSIPNGTYYWRVRAKDSSGNASSWTSAWAVIVDVPTSGDKTPPPAPTLQSPPDGYTIASLPYTFDWTDVNDNNTGGSNPCTYEIQIDNDNSFSSPEVDQSGLTQSQYTLTSSIPNGRYYWRVRAKDNAGNTSVWSSTRTVTVNVSTSGDRTPPPTPILQSPPDGYTIASLPYTFDWTDVNDNNTGGSNPCTYEIQIDNDNSFSSPEVDQSGLTQSQYTLTSSIPNGTYYWHVRAKDSAGNLSDWTSARTVIVNIGAPKVDRIKVVPNFVSKGTANNVKLEYHVSSPGEIRIRIYSVDGQLVKEITKIKQQGGVYEETWRMQDDNGAELPSGIYLIYYTTDKTTTPLVEKVIYVK